MNGTRLQRFWAKIQVNPATGCWVWTAATKLDGYGRFYDGMTDRGTTKLVLPHRWAYEHFVAPIPDGLQLDHLCRVRLCCNPSHLEPVTGLENVRRGVISRRAERGAAA